MKSRSFLLYLLLILVSGWLLTFRLNTYPAIWFDEGYKLNAARTLSERGVYGTYTVDGYVPFDPGISSGPIDVIPIAIMFKLFGTGVMQARWVSVVFTLAAVLAFYRLAQLLYGERIALLVTCFAIAIPALGASGFLLIGRQILGEPAALACTLFGLWLWYRSWKTGRWLPAIASGLIMGVGMLSKTQVAIALFPALVLTGLLRYLKERKQFWKLMTPSILVLLTFGVWMLIGALSTPAAIRQENSKLLMDAIQSNLLTPLFGRGLNRQSWLIVALMALGAGGSLYNALRKTPQGRLVSAEQWAELSIGLFLLCYVVWFAFLSIGWPRYAYVGLVVALIPVGKLLWNVGQLANARLRFDGQVAYPAMIGAVFFFGVATNVTPALKDNSVNNTQAVANYIDAHIPPDAVIETWEWEIDALSHHWEFHHPNQRYLFEAIRQFSYEAQGFHLDYDILQANPHYLITGSFSDWTGLYSQADIQANFTPVATFGAYTIYQRNGSEPDQQ